MTLRIVWEEGHVIEEDQCVNTAVLMQGDCMDLHGLTQSNRALNVEWFAQAGRWRSSRGGMLRQLVGHAAWRLLLIHSPFLLACPEVPISVITRTERERADGGKPLFKL